VELTLLTRAYCHLCDEMRQTLEPLLAGTGVTLRVIDVDDDAALEARWSAEVPVLLDDDALLCAHRLDRAALASWLRASAAAVAPEQKIG
jgi:glutaredoxin